MQCMNILNRGMDNKENFLISDDGIRLGGALLLITDTVLQVGRVATTAFLTL